MARSHPTARLSKASRYYLYLRAGNAVLWPRISLSCSWTLSYPLSWLGPELPLSYLHLPRHSFHPISNTYFHLLLVLIQHSIIQKELSSTFKPTPGVCHKQFNMPSAETMGSHPATALGQLKTTGKHVLAKLQQQTSNADIIDIRRVAVEINLKTEITSMFRPKDGPRQLPTLLLYNERGLQLFEKASLPMLRDLETIL